MQPFVNPNYYLANPYLQNQTMYQQPVQQPYSSLSGKYVNDFAEITANDVPMNGIPAIFASYPDIASISLRVDTAGVIVSGKIRVEYVK